MNRISEWMDGELTAHETRHLVDRLKVDADLRHGWDIFHLIGDVMRGERALSTDFERRVAARLADEPTVLAPRAPAVRRTVTYALSAAASLSAVALVGWLAFVNNPLAPPPPQIAQPQTAPVPESIPAEPQLASVPSDGTMNEYLIAHQEFSPSSEIQGLAPYIRGVSSLRTVQGR
ncbi:MAG TPA: sigma-E factor negative regulatory protein [Burkholderiales bacterium]|nr:sigma-E factor negative regulatory protein [Burkholderiales bacterium]